MEHGTSNYKTLKGERGTLDDERETCNVNRDNMELERWFTVDCPRS